jgi:hypothetical protein
MTPIIVTFPRDDTAFAAYVRSTLDRQLAVIVPEPPPHATDRVAS